jgi:predicted negative regulator of RcsB-dependent stress response
MLSKNASRWFGFLVLLMLALRFGYKYYRSQQRPAYEAQMETLQTKNQALIKAIQADQEAQRAAGKTTIRADSAVIAADSTLRTK